MNVSAMPEAIGHSAGLEQDVFGLFRTSQHLRHCSDQILRMLQQTQPLARLMTSPSLSMPTTSSASMLIEPKSFTSTATRRP